MGCLESLPKVSRCCCCVPLSIGVKIIAILELIFAILATISAFSAIFLYDENNSSNYHSGGIFVYGGIVGSVLQLILALFLTYGVFKPRAGFILVWLIGQAVIFCLAVLSFIIFIVLYFLQLTDVLPQIHQNFVFGSILGAIISIVIWIWFWLTVNSFYVRLLQTWTSNVHLRSSYAYSSADPDYSMGPYQRSYAYSANSSVYPKLSSNRNEPWPEKGTSKYYYIVN